MYINVILVRDGAPDIVVSCNEAGAVLSAVMVGAELDNGEQPYPVEKLNKETVARLFPAAKEAAIKRADKEAAMIEQLKSCSTIKEAIAYSRDRECPEKAPYIAGGGTELGYKLMVLDGAMKYLDIYPDYKHLKDFPDLMSEAMKINID